MTSREAWRSAYRFIRMDGRGEWSDDMRPFKTMAIDALLCRDGQGRRRSVTWVSAASGDSVVETPPIRMDGRSRRTGPASS